MLRQTYASVTEYAELAQKLPDDVYAAILSTNDPGYLADFIAQQLNLRYQDKQDILDELRPLPRLQRMNEILRREIEVTAMEQDIESKVRSRVGKIQKDFVLREQIKVLQNEIGEGGEDEELDEYREKISKAHLSEEVERKLLKMWTSSPSSRSAAPRRVCCATISTPAWKCPGARRRRSALA